MALPRNRIIATGAVCAAAVFTLAGCGSSGTSSTSATSSTAPAATTPASAPPASSAVAPVASPTVVTVTETEFSIALSQSAFKPGQYTFTVVNQGRAPHNLAIKGPGIDPPATSQTVQNGTTTQLSATLAPGSYELWCTVGNHKASGMDMTIQVS